MTFWDNGYVTDVAYGEGFHPLQNPGLWLLSVTVAGIEAPDVSRGYRYCDLGCGQGDTILILAANNPACEFHAIDFNPAHIAHARRRARKAGIGNISFHEASFDDLSRLHLPMLDFVSLHGVWSWIAPTLQDAIVEFLADHLVAGGLAHVSYNVMPGWDRVAPLQRLIREFANLAHGTSDRAVATAIGRVGDLREAGLLPGRFLEPLKAIEDRLSAGMSAYLAHELLDAHWAPPYHADVARKLAAAKLVYAGQAEPLRNFGNLGLTPEQAKGLQDIEPPELRETLKDFGADQQFRHDIYVRGRRRLSASQREARLAKTRLVLTRSVANGVRVTRADGGEWRTDVRVYAPVLESLAKGPRTVGELLALPDLPETHAVTAVELAGVLVGAEVAAPYRAPSPEAIEACHRLNEQLGQTDQFGAPRPGIVTAPAIGLALHLDAVELALYGAANMGEDFDTLDLARRFQAACVSKGVHPVYDGKLLDDQPSAVALLAETFERLMIETLPIWMQLGML